ncbi:putative membrane protein YhdT [Crossiella equi]|uniref:Membrane protein YhdT n=1 Tax=Crossiella equi TaxID=130796 RepID=A0ABS5AEK8_9PSEU|nr:hypothetical protein [Crossiella equi]MBP2475019.1 putative membrane protein YhdT [Crossiella equi]
MAATAPKIKLIPVAIALFAIGIAAVAGVFGLFASGYTELPLWLNLACLLAPAGLALGAFAVFRQSRKDRG